jgi:ATP-binding cassette subfamily E protein 1
MNSTANLTHRIAVLDEELCQPRKCGLECIVYCPVNKTGGECIVLSEDRGKAVISEDLCTGCGICVKKCPFDAIVIVNLARELGDQKIHQYGINSFRLYNLPTPRKGYVVGLLGKNAIGKSSVVNLLAGSTIPNFGNYDSEPALDDVLKKFQGTELQSHFRKIATREIRVSIKPQLVYQIPNVFSGTALELLRKYDERKISTDLIEDLGLQDSLDQNVRNLSGGQLQRLAVAVASAKDADYYFFDEPSSYNDVYQRLVVARTIRSLAKEGKSVMVVEHDMTLLDYLSDYIHIVYGEPGAYGIVSGPQSTKQGINDYLEGFIATENVRFRDKAFKFETRSSAEDIISENAVARYSDLSKGFPSFHLKISAGAIRYGEIVGVIGANSLGKTTFMRMLAGLDKPDNGTIDASAKISFKPQYLSQEYDGSVYSLLSAACEGMQNMSLMEDQILNPLGIKRLYERNVRNLSGGELQKVAIAATLLRPASIYALDEPSAFLDVEDRIALSKFLQRFVRAQGKSSVVIDHDMQIIDIVADSLVIFDGRPGLEGLASQPLQKEEGMNKFLRNLSITYRRDENTGRPRINKDGSRLDRSQKDSGDYYYTKRTHE